jgi:hypothetical protein
MKQKIKAKITLSFASPEKKLLFYIYAVIVKQIFYKRSTNNYAHSTKKYTFAQQGRPRAVPATEFFSNPKADDAWHTFSKVSALLCSLSKSRKKRTFLSSIDQVATPLPFEKPIFSLYIWLIINI